MAIVELIVIILLLLVLFVPKKNIEKYQIQIAGAIVYGLTVVFLVYLVFLSLAVNKDLYKFLYDWQGLVGAVSTIGAGIWAYQAALLPHRERKREEAAAAKATLAMVLSDTLEELDVVYKKIDDDIKFKNSFSVLNEYNTKLCSDLTDKYQNCVKHLPVEIAERISDILSRVQIVRARINIFYKDDKDKQGQYYIEIMKQILVTLIDIKIRVNKLFNYARDGKRLHELAPRREIEDEYESIRGQMVGGDTLEDLRTQIDRLPQ